MRVLFVANGREQLGIEYLSAVLNDRGHRTALALDPSLFNDGYLDWPWLHRRFGFHQRLLSIIDDFKPDLVAVSCLTDGYLWACDIARHIKQCRPTPIVFGGYHVTCAPEFVAKNPDVDFMILGEGEQALPALVENLSDEQALRNLPNLWFTTKSNEQIRNPVGPYIMDLDSLPFADKELFHRVAPYFTKHYRIISTRDCPYHCTYCSVPVQRKLYADHHKGVRRRSPKNVIEELEERFERYQFDFINFGDDNFLLQQSWLEDFTERYVRGPRKPFKCMTHPSHVTNETAQMLAKANCSIVELGVQSTNDETRRRVIHRRETNEIVTHAVNALKNKGIIVEVDHILGFPGEGEDEARQALEFYNELRPSVINAFWLRPYPGTEIITHLKAAGMMTDDDEIKINQGYGASYIERGYQVTKDTQTHAFLLMSALPLWPKSWMRRSIRNSWSNRKRRFCVFMFLISRLVLSLRWKDYRLTFLVRHYLFSMKYLLPSRHSRVRQNASADKETG